LGEIERDQMPRQKMQPNRISKMNVDQQIGIYSANVFLTQRNVLES